MFGTQARNLNQNRNCSREFMLYDSSLIFFAFALFECLNLLFATVWWISHSDSLSMHSSKDFVAFLAHLSPSDFSNSWSLQSHRDVLLIKQWNLCFYHFLSPFSFASASKSFVWKNVLKEPLILSDPNLCAFFIPLRLIGVVYIIFLVFTTQNLLWNPSKVLKYLGRFLNF